MQTYTFDYLLIIPKRYRVAFEANDQGEALALFPDKVQQLPPVEVPDTEAEFLVTITKAEGLAERDRLDALMQLTQSLLGDDYEKVIRIAYYKLLLDQEVKPWWKKLEANQA